MLIYTTLWKGKRLDYLGLFLNGIAIMRNVHERFSLELDCFLYHLCSEPGQNTAGNHWRVFFAWLAALIPPLNSLFIRLLSATWGFFKVYVRAKCQSAKTSSLHLSITCMFLLFYPLKNTAEKHLLICQKSRVLQTSFLGWQHNAFTQDSS